MTDPIQSRRDRRLTAAEYEANKEGRSDMTEFALEPSPVPFGIESWFKNPTMPPLPPEERDRIIAAIEDSRQRLMVLMETRRREALADWPVIVANYERVAHKYPPEDTMPEQTSTPGPGSLEIKGIMQVPVEDYPDGPPRIMRPGSRPSDRSMIESAWGLLANAYGGDWSSARADWRRAAERWRDAYGEYASGSDDSPVPGSMTLEERAEAVWHLLLGRDDKIDECRIIAAAIRAAVAEERDECARVAESKRPHTEGFCHDLDQCDLCEDIAAAIRARSNAPSQPNV
jgi:hypothetical protein